MSQHMTLAASPVDSKSGANGHSQLCCFTELSPEIQQGMYRRLGGIGLVYSGTWLVTLVYYTFMPSPRYSPEQVFYWRVATAICALLGVMVYALCRTRRIPIAWFVTFAMTFEIAGGLGIMAGAFGWEHAAVGFLDRVGTALGMGLSDLVPPLDHAGLRLLYSEGVSWVSVWLLAFPLIVPLSTWRTATATLLTAATVPFTFLASLALNGTPPEVANWAMPYIAEATVPTFICAGIAILGSRVVYGLAHDLTKAKQLGSYRLVERIGMGGMGEVWRAKHQLLMRPAAIKLIRPEALGGDSSSARTALRRFKREAQATSGLSSPHSIELYDFGVTEDGTFYYVMELLDGVDLKTLVEKYGPIPAERAIHILRQMCHSLIDAHNTGVIHRDIKPGNIFLSRRGLDHDFVKILDFGLVKQVDEPLAGSTQLTLQGLTSGTPAFMAPEMAYGDRETDARADIYALGCVAYWLLTGQLVFVGETALSVLLQHATEPAPPPSTRTEIEIPPDLEALILGCLEKDVARRPQSAREVRQRLDECAQHLSAPWSDERAERWWQTHLPRAAGVAAATAP